MKLSRKKSQRFTTLQMIEHYVLYDVVKNFLLDIQKIKGGLDYHPATNLYNSLNEIGNGVKLSELLR
jgi:hypothetical protein